MKLLGADDKWAGQDWEQSPPKLDTDATDMKERAWHLKIGITTRYAHGSTPERIIQASQLLWNQGFGCLELMKFPPGTRAF